MLFASTVWHAAHQGRFALVELGWTCVYGLVLEWLTLRVLHAYHYGQFLIMIDNTPLCIGLSWALIIYASMHFSDRFQLAEPVHPMVDALMALSIDLGLDVVAVRLGLWHWNGLKLDQEWFGIPWANFGAWFIVVWSYSGFIRALRVWQHQRWRRWLYGPMAVLLSLLVLTVASMLCLSMPGNVGSITPLVLVVGSLATVADSHPELALNGWPDPIVVAVPLGFHLFATVAGIGFGIYARQPLLGVIELVILGISFFVHLLPFVAWRLRKLCFPRYG